MVDFFNLREKGTVPRPGAAAPKAPLKGELPPKAAEGSYAA